MFGRVVNTPWSFSRGQQTLNLSFTKYGKSFFYSLTSLTASSLVKINLEQTSKIKKLEILTLPTYMFKMFVSFVFPYFNSSILYFICFLFDGFFVFDLF